MTVPTLCRFALRSKFMLAGYPNHIPFTNITMLRLQCVLPLLALFFFFDLHLRFPFLLKEKKEKT